MDFFKSVFSDEPEPESRSPSAESESESESVRTDPTSSSNQPDPNPTETTGGGGAWNFGGLFRTLTSSSGSVIETYRRDLQEFGSELRKEIQVAQGSLENVGQAIDELGSSVFKGTAQFIAQGKDAILAMENESDSSDTNAANSSQRDLGSKRYSRFEAQVRAIQSNPATYSEEADDVEDYRKWKSEFVMESREEIERLLAENNAMESVYTKLVPGSVDEETFWCRYFYKVHKLKQTEELRAKLVKRAISSEEDDLSWDVEEEDEEERKDREEKEEGKGNVDSGGRNPATVAQGAEVIEGSSQNVKNHEGEEMGKSKDGQIGDVKEEEGLKGTEKSGDGGNAVTEKVDMEISEGEGDVVSKSDEKASVEEKGDNGGSSKDSDFSVVSSRATSQDQEEDDLGWDEIEDLRGIDEKKVVSHGGASLSKVELHKRLIAAEEEDDLSWDIEVDDEPVKS